MRRAGEGGTLDGIASTTALSVDAMCGRAGAFGIVIDGRRRRETNSFHDAE
jgi:hypothetical protein